MTIDSLIKRRGAPVLYHREGDTVACPCRTPEGYRDPEWHKANPTYPECNDAGFFADSIEFNIKGIIIPAFMGGRRNFQNVLQNITEMFGEIKADDHLGVFPISWGGINLNFDDWSPAGEEYIEYLSKRFLVIAWSSIPDPHDTSIIHHFEVVLRRINKNQLGTVSH